MGERVVSRVAVEVVVEVWIGGGYFGIDIGLVDYAPL